MDARKTPIALDSLKVKQIKKVDEEVKKKGARVIRLKQEDKNTGKQVKFDLTATKS